MKLHNWSESEVSDWDLNPWTGTWTQPKPGLGLEPTVFYWNCTSGVRTYWISDSLCLSAEGIQWEAKWYVRCRFIERDNTPHRVWTIAEVRVAWEIHIPWTECGPSQKVIKWPQNISPAILVRISRNWATAYVLAFYVSLATVMVLVCVSFRLQWVYYEAQGPLEIEPSAILDTVVSTSLCCSLNGYVILLKLHLTPSLLFQ